MISFFSISEGGLSVSEGSVNIACIASVFLFYLGYLVTFHCVAVLHIPFKYEFNKTALKKNLDMVVWAFSKHFKMVKLNTKDFVQQEMCVHKAVSLLSKSIACHLISFVDGINVYPGFYGSEWDYYTTHLIW